MTQASELSVTGVTIESIYNNYTNHRFHVNRRYQRKLVWSIDEKRSLVDSIFSQYPIPLFLFADIKSNGAKHYEVIDGMQRLNAIIYFIENKVDYDGSYFDLQSLSATKAKLDKGELEQRTPVLSREDCLAFTSYIIPQSLYDFETPDQVDEVFKRINSLGRYLSRQELRVAGSLGEFATLVRKVSASIRGDSSQSDTFSLDRMPYISLAFTDEDIGIRVQDIFWVRHGIITKELLRESRDEEIVCDILASVALGDMPPSSSERFNEYYGFPSSTARTSELASSVSRLSPDEVEQQVLTVMDDLRSLFRNLQTTFSALCFSKAPAQSPRYFTALFLAAHHLRFKKGRRLADHVGAKESLRNVCDDLNVSTGGNWSATNKESNKRKLVGILDPHCEDVGVDDPALANWTTRIENILNQSLIEQQLYDYKIGFTDLSDSPAYQEGTVSTIVQTLVAMINLGKNKVGYVIVGVADRPSDAERVKELYGIESLERFGKHIVGIEHDCQHLGLTADTLFSKICASIDTAPIDASLKNDLTAGAKVVSYQAKSLVVFELRSCGQPQLFDDKYFVRDGTSTRELETNEMPWLFGKFSG